MKRKITAILLALTMALGLAACGTASTGSSTTAPASGTGTEAPATTNYPTKAITILCPWSAGGGSDLAIRTLVPYLEKELGTSITVVNSTGANGWIAWLELYNSEPDGYTIAQMNIPTFSTGYLDRTFEREHISLDDFIPLCNEISDWGCLVVKAGRFATAEEFVEYAKTNTMTAGDSGQGTNKHVLTEKLKNELNLQLTAVHQAGWSETYAAILGGHIDVGWGSIGESLQGYEDGEVEVLAVFAPERSKVMPDVPTFEECGFPLITSPSDRGYVAPAGLDPEILAVLDAAFDAAINNPEFVATMEGLGQSVNYMNRETYTQYCIDNEDDLRSYADIMGWDMA